MLNFLSCRRWKSLCWAFSWMSSAFMFLLSSLLMWDSEEFECVGDGDGFTFNEHRSFGGWLVS